jgi:hypothetical protein
MEGGVHFNRFGDTRVEVAAAPPPSSYPPTSPTGDTWVEVAAAPPPPLYPANVTHTQCHPFPFPLPSLHTSSRNLNTTSM